MAIPVIMAVGGGTAAMVGIAKTIKATKKIKNASEKKGRADEIRENIKEKFEWEMTTTSNLLDDIGKRELEILLSFDKFSDLMERIQNRPNFQELKLDKIQIPEYEIGELREISNGAKVLLGGIGGAAAGTAGGFAAAGAISSAVMTLGTASTGTAISTLSGVAATNATLAVIGGGTVAAGGGGMALGTIMLGISSLGAGLMVGGIIFNIAGSKISDQAEKAYELAEEAKEKARKICNYLSELNEYATEFLEYLKRIEKIYRNSLQKLEDIVNVEEKRDWQEFTLEEKRDTQNTVLLVGILYKMCNAKLVLKAEQEDSLNIVNREDISNAVELARSYGREENMAVNFE